MNFKYYDLLSTIIVGYFAIMAYLIISGIEYNNDLSVAYIAAGYVVGYIINAVAGLMESFWYWTIGGMPSDVLLTPKTGQDYTGIRRVRFYHATEAVTKLREQLKDPQANTGKMFSVAMREANSNVNSRVPDFNAQYAFSRVLLTTILFVSAILIGYHPCDWKTYLILFPLLIAWNRFKERGYYYAREVLNEYLKNHK